MQINDLPSEFPDAKGHFGPYGGVFVAETLVHALDEHHLPSLSVAIATRHGVVWTTAVGEADLERVGGQRGGQFRQFQTWVVAGGYSNHRCRIKPMRITGNGKFGLRKCCRLSSATPYLSGIRWVGFF